MLITVRAPIAGTVLEKKAVQGHYVGPDTMLYLLADLMVVYLEQAYERWRGEGRLRTTQDLIACALDGAVLRVRPLLMTVGMNLVGLAPVMTDFLDDDDTPHHPGGVREPAERDAAA